MSPKRHSNIVATRGRSPVFGALGDETRLSLVQHGSISQLTEGSNLSRQAITKHLRVLERVGIVRCVRKGRESRFQFNPEPIEGIREYLDFVSQQ
jgi:DNA-binding transcriptional ArsR family regulator